MREFDVLYQIYPLGFCGAERTAVPGVRQRLDALAAVIPDIAALGCDGVLLNPVFQSGTHGYDVTDYFTVDTRLGTNEAFASLVGRMHEAGLGVVTDAVFDHTGRGFGPFADVLANRGGGRYRDWFFIRDGDTPYGDGFYYEPWEGHFELVRLNLNNPEVQDYLLRALRFWVEAFGIDGLRLDVAYMLPPPFLRRLKEAAPDLWIVGEMIHGDYGRFLDETGLDSVTDYVCYKGLYSAINSRNLFEIEHSLTRLFGAEPWAVCRGRRLLNFADNHDVTRLYTMLNDKRDVYAAYTILFAMPGIPCVYYGSEYRAEGDKRAGDEALRPAWADIDTSDRTLYDFIARLAAIRRAEPGLKGTSYRKLFLTNTALAFGRDDVVAAVNIAEEPVHVDLGRCVSLIDGRTYGGTLPGKSADLLKLS